MPQTAGSYVADLFAEYAADLVPRTQAALGLSTPSAALDFLERQWQDIYAATIPREIAIPLAQMWALDMIHTRLRMSSAFDAWVATRRAELEV